MRKEFKTSEFLFTINSIFILLIQSYMIKTQPCSPMIGISFSIPYYHFKSFLRITFFMSYSKISWPIIKLSIRIVRFKSDFLYLKLELMMLPYFTIWYPWNPISHWVVKYLFLNVWELFMIWLKSLNIESYLLTSTSVGLFLSKTIFIYLLIPYIE